MPRPSAIDIGFKIPIPLLWQIKKTSKQIPLSELEHNLDINYREQENTDDWNLSPRTCLENLQKEKSHFQKIQKADLQFPIILYYYKKQWIILDGVHRFAKAQKNKQNHILAKCLIFEDIQHLITNGEKPIFLFEKTPFPFEKAIMQKCFSPTFLENFRKHHYFSAKLYKNFFSQISLWTQRN